MAGPQKRTRRKVALALAGGGAHSAFTWGALQFLLEDRKRDIEVVAISGTSGGAMNAAVAGYGLGTGDDPESAALALLEQFWTTVSLTAFWHGNPYQHIRNPLWPSWNIDATPLSIMLGMASSAVAPGQISTPHRNPLRQVLTSLLDFQRFADGRSFPDLYICATNVGTSQLTVFERRDLAREEGPDMLCASACLPSVDWPVEIGKDVYWDGGYRADPAISPLLQSPRLRATNDSKGGAERDDVDVILIGINPLIREDVPRTAWQILDRLNEISMNSAMIDEVKRLMTFNDVLDSIHALPPNVRNPVMAVKPLKGRRRVRLHYIESEREMASLGVASKNNTALPFLEELRDIGHRAARRWWDEDGGSEDFADGGSRRWRAKIVKRFIDPHHWQAERTAGARAVATGETSETSAATQSTGVTMLPP